MRIESLVLLVSHCLLLAMPQHHLTLLLISSFLLLFIFIISDLAIISLFIIKFANFMTIDFLFLFSNQILQLIQQLKRCSILLFFYFCVTFFSFPFCLFFLFLPPSKFQMNLPRHHNFDLFMLRPIFYRKFVVLDSFYLMTLLIPINLLVLMHLYYFQI